MNASEQCELPPMLTAQELADWIALSRVHTGAVVRHRGEYLDGGAPMPRTGQIVSGSGALAVGLHDERILLGPVGSDAIVTTSVRLRPLAPLSSCAGGSLIGVGE